MMIALKPSGMNSRLCLGAEPRAIHPMPGVEPV